MAGTGFGGPLLIWYDLIWYDMIWIGISHTVSQIWFRYQSSLKELYENNPTGGAEINDTVVSWTFIMLYSFSDCQFLKFGNLNDIFH